jgi:alpha-tubulin suppressor-like RCC1 family protein
MDDGVYVWGRNDKSQLGLGDNKHRSSPVRNNTLSSFHIVCFASSSEFSLAVTQQGDLLAWGNNTNGQLGLGDQVRRKTPQRVASLSHKKITRAVCSLKSSLVVTEEGTLFAFGYNTNGQLGLGDTRDRLLPTELTSISEKIISVSSGRAHSLALTEDGKIYAWGFNDSGQLGLGHAHQQNQPKKLTLSEKIIVIACGAHFSVSLTQRGHIYIWGNGEFGELGFGNFETSFTPKKLTLPEKISTITCGHNHTLAVSERGGFYLWGCNKYGQLGFGDRNHRNLPEKSNLDFQISAIFAGSSHNMVLTKSGIFFVWGWNEWRQLGLGHVENRHSPEILLRSKFSGKTLGYLLETGIFSDFSGLGMPLHRCILQARCPKFLEFDFSGVPNSLVSLVIEWIYKNSARKILKFSGIEELCSAAKLSEALELRDLRETCLGYLPIFLDGENAFPALSLCAELGLDQEVTWILYFIGKTKIAPSVEMISKIASFSPKILQRAFSEVIEVTIPDPKIENFRVVPIGDDLEKIFLSGEFSDFSLNVGKKKFSLHKCLLSAWEFSNIIFRDSSCSLEFPSPGGIRVFRIPADTFSKILQFFYAGKTSGISVTDAGWISAASEFYLLRDTELYYFCAGLLKQLDSVNWSEAYVVGARVGDKELQERALAAAPLEGVALCGVVRVLDDLLKENEELKIKEESEDSG